MTNTQPLAKWLRDARESGSVVSRLDQARVERILAEFDPYRQHDPAYPDHHAAPTDGYVPMQAG